MTTTKPLTTKEIDRRITAAWHALKSARTGATRSPNAETLRLESLAEAVLNHLLDQRHQQTR